MSYRCQNCNEAQPSGHQPTKIVVETRRKSYGEYAAVGTEIVREVSVCPPCSEQIFQEQRDLQQKREEALLAQQSDRSDAWRDGVTHES